MHTVHRRAAPRVDVLLPIAVAFTACTDATGSGEGGRWGAAPGGTSTTGGRLPETDAEDGGGAGPATAPDATAGVTGGVPTTGGHGEPGGDGGRGGAPPGDGGATSGDGGAPTAPAAGGSTTTSTVEASSAEGSTADASSAEGSTAEASSAESTAAATSTSADASSAAGPSTGAGGGPGAMSFFVTSVGHGSGNFGGLPGVDAHCQALATAAGAGDRTWRAYVSSSAVDARDRIGTGPWYDAQGVLVATDVAALLAGGIAHERALDEHGAAVPNGITAPGMNEHDILTGSTPGGTFSGDACADWTSSSSVDRATVGHCDASFTEGGGTSPVSPSDHWSSAHTSQGCDAASLDATGSTGRVYCFAP